MYAGVAERPLLYAEFAERRVRIEAPRGTRGRGTRRRARDLWRAAPCVVETEEIKIDGSCPTRKRGLLLGGRSTVGHVALDHVIGVRIPASQPLQALRSFVAARPGFRHHATPLRSSRRWANPCLPATKFLLWYQQVAAPGDFTIEL